MINNYNKWDSTTLKSLKVMDENKNNNSVDLDAIANKLGEMSPEELKEFALKEAKARADQEGFNQKLKAEITTLKEPKQEPVKVEEPKEPVAPVVESLSQGEAFAISKLAADGYSQEEINAAKSLVGTTFGGDLLSVASSAGFQAQLSKDREVAKSSEMQIADLSGLQAPTTDAQFLEQERQGLIDLSIPTHAERFKKLKVKEMRVSKA